MAILGGRSAKEHTTGNPGQVHSLRAVRRTPSRTLGAVSDSASLHPPAESDSGCPFCLRIKGQDVELASAQAVAFADGFPLSPGHTLVVPRRHVANFFELNADEQSDLWRLVADVQRALAERERPHGFNVGLNVGAAAGQTVAHAHVHVIPRYTGDVADPRGGVRWVLPAKAAYWSSR